MTDPKPDSLTRFHSAESLRELVVQAVVAGTSPRNWLGESGLPDAVGDIVDDAMFQLKEIVELRIRDFMDNVWPTFRGHVTQAEFIDGLIHHTLEGE